jgi:hypothetical protein
VCVVPAKERVVVFLVFFLTLSLDNIDYVR